MWIEEEVESGPAITIVEDCPDADDDEEGEVIDGK